MNIAVWSMQAFAAMLMLAWALPHALVLRFTLLALMMVALIYTSVKRPLIWKLPKALKVPLSIYAVLTIWILFQAIFISPETHWSLMEFRGQWARSTLTFVLGLGLGSVLIERGSSSVRLFAAILVGVMSFQVIFNVCDVIWLRSMHHNWDLSYAPFDAPIANGKSGMSYINNVLLAFLVAEVLGRVNLKSRFLPISNGFIGCIFIFVAINAGLIYARNGIIGALFLVISAALLTWFERRHSTNNLRLGAAVIGVLVLVVAAGLTDYQLDSRWATFRQTLPYALNTTTYKAWLDREKYPYPVLANGQVVAASNYERVAWIKEGVITILERPFGVGYGRGSFGHALFAKYGDGQHVQSHSGLIDFTVGTGIPGLILWFMFIIAIFVMAWRNYLKNRNVLPLIMIFITSGFVGRSFIDNNMRDDMMEQFMFLLGLFATMIFSSDEKSSKE